MNSGSNRKKSENINIKLIGIFVTIALAITGYAYTYIKDVELSSRKAKLERVSSQLQYLYGPLYSVSYAQERVWVEFRKKNRPGKGYYWDTFPPPTDIEAKEWRLWMENVFMPLNIQMEKIILGNTHLLVEEEIPDPLLSLLAHIEGYRATLAKWKNGDYSVHTSFFNYPTEIKQYSLKHYIELKKKQSLLIGEVESE